MLCVENASFIATFLFRDCKTVGKTLFSGPTEGRNFGHVCKSTHDHCLNDSDVYHEDICTCSHSTSFYHSDQEAFDANKHRLSFRSVRSRRDGIPLNSVCHHIRSYEESQRPYRSGKCSYSTQYRHECCSCYHSQSSMDTFEDADRKEHPIIAQVAKHLASLRKECPDSLPRCRKLQSARKILHRLLLEGESSCFISLKHDVVRYPGILKETPGIIHILQLAGYIIEREEFVMPYIDRIRVATIIAELDREIQASIIEI